MAQSTQCQSNKDCEDGKAQSSDSSSGEENMSSKEHPQGETSQPDRHPRIAMKSPRYLPPSTSETSTTTSEPKQKRRRTGGTDTGKTHIRWNVPHPASIPEGCPWKQSVRSGFLLTSPDGRHTSIAVGQFVFYGEYPAIVIDATNDYARHANTFRVRRYEYVDAMKKASERSKKTSRGNRIVGATNAVCTLFPKDASAIRPVCVDDCNPACDFVVSKTAFGYSADIKKKLKKPDAKIEFDYVGDELFETRVELDAFLDGAGITTILPYARYQHEIENKITRPFELIEVKSVETVAARPEQQCTEPCVAVASSSLVDKTHKYETTMTVTSTTVEQMAITTTTPKTLSLVDLHMATAAIFAEVGEIGPVLEFSVRSLRHVHDEVVALKRVLNDVGSSKQT